ncbi:hypothetical protein [Virgibacillus salidurans]|nr:hypothetical protein [Virgibacillus sp. NKC19-16]
MKKILVALFITIILGVGIIGYVQAIDQPAEVIEDNDYSTRITS